MKSMADLFAERGDPMDSRIPLHFGRDAEPARASYRIQPDGFCHGEILSDTYFWSELPEAGPLHRVPTPYERPHRTAVADVQDVRRNFRKLDRADVVYLGQRPVAPPELPPVNIFVGKDSHKGDHEKPAEDFSDFAARERAEHQRYLVWKAARS